MPALRRNAKVKLPRRLEELVQLMPPQAIMDDGQYESTIEIIDRLMSSGKLSKGQERYLETLVQLVQVYEASHYAVAAPSGLEMLKHLLEQHDLTAADLSRILGVHASMGSKILKSERLLTVKHLKILAAKFNVRPDVFID